jgi:hypothetical protein
MMDLLRLRNPGLEIPDADAFWGLQGGLQITVWVGVGRRMVGVQVRKRKVTYLPPLMSMPFVKTKRSTSD